MTGALSEERRAMAAEYVLGVLDPAGMDDAARLIEADAAFAAEVARWERHMAGFDRTVSPADVPPALWARIEAKLGEQAPAAESTGQPTLEISRARELYEAGKLPITSGEAAADARRRLFGWLWGNLAFWRLGALAAAAAAVALTVGLSAQLRQARAVPVLIAILQTDDNRAAAVVNAFADGRTELVPLTTFTVPAGRVLEVWTLWDRQVGPRSVGLLQAMQAGALNLRDFPRGEGQLFEITLEPAGGSPVGRPTGPILAKGLTARSL
jgi:anti-sigma-K factor RskA